MIKSLYCGLILISLLAGCQTLPQVQATGTPPIEPTMTVTATILPTATLHPVAHVGGSVPCFAGPQVDENIVGTLEISYSPEIEGADESGQFWAIRREDGSHCWVEAAYVTASSDPGPVGVVMPTPTQRPPKPPAPKNAKIEYKCFMKKFPNHVDATLSWDKTEWAEGYRIYRGLKILAELDASETQFVTTIERRFFSSGSGVATYTIEAYNSSGWSTVDLPIKWYCNQ